jgi:hypothetical protein
MQHRLAARHGHQLQLSAFQSIVGLQQIIQLVAEQLRNYVALGEAESLGCYPFDLVIREEFLMVRTRDVKDSRVAQGCI